MPGCGAGPSGDHSNFSLGAPQHRSIEVLDREVSCFFVVPFHGPPSSPSLSPRSSTMSSFKPDNKSEVDPTEGPRLDYVDSLPDQEEYRPPIEYHSPGAFVSSCWRRFRSVWTQRFILSLLAGQVVSLCITCTNVTTTELVDRNWSLPTTQTWFLCVFKLYWYTSCA